MKIEEIEKEARSKWREIGREVSFDGYRLGFLAGISKGQEEIDKFKSYINKAIIEIHDNDRYFEGMKILGDLIGVKFAPNECKVIPTTLHKLMNRRLP
jgi:hypothetical protein